MILYGQIIKNGGALKMKMPKNEENNFKRKFNESARKQSKSKRTYIALGVCVIAVSAIAWSTYQSVNTFISPFRNSSATRSSNKVSKSVNSETNKNSILNDEDDEKTGVVKGGKSIPYGKQKEVKPKDLENTAEKTQPVSVLPSDFQYVYPVESKDILKEFSEGKPIYSATMGDWRAHEGTDFKAEIGSKVKSVAEGIVKDVYQDSSYGTTVAIEHKSGFLAYYSGLDKGKIIEKGKKVNAGDIIGTIGKVPCEISDPPHLHLSVFKDSEFVNPMAMLNIETH